MLHRSREGAPDECPDENVLVGLAHGAPGAVNTPELERHLDGCAACRAILAVVAEDSEPDLANAPTHLETGAPTLPAVPETPLFRAGHPLGRYLLEGTLGQGGMGVVYAARDPMLGRTVALKLLRPGLGGDEARARLVREAQAMARLAHPNVLPLFELGMEGEHVFLVMERVEGPTLAEWLRARERPWREVLAILLQAGEGLAAAHRAGLVHRDFKPGNVLVGADGRPRVTDFGLVRDAEVGTEGEAVAGTPAYMSPEQLAGREVDARGDQFSFCVTLYEALYGVRPFDTRAREERSRWRRMPRPRSPRPPRALRAALDRGLALRPEDRFPSLDALLAALRVPSRFRWGPVVAMGVGLSLALVGGEALRSALQDVWISRENESIELRMGEPVDLTLPQVERLTLGDSSIVGVEPPIGDVIRVTPKGPGQTLLRAWTRDGQLRQYSLSVRAH
ncbi:serine/threonine-protein kinase [Melittangium boletus]|uniref:Protein kinase domain-containing protein n=1 Tax=Melittangium boletus DSM 14713 TaxID=1294270 RepID=A0A250IPY8_9BACT|nr:serine/threonine-protein kinase [Melittangium boletus]ATB33227.1 hypothetical protein MEBOL_006716 [Melittangium boletus DSM 14713]